MPIGKRIPKELEKNFSEEYRYPLIRVPEVSQILSTFKGERFINKKTKIVSIGSCFAENIGKYLRAHKYNYISTEKGSGWFSANW